MQRYNTFTMIHKALRALLYDTALSLQQTYFADASEAATALQKIETVIHQFEQHTHHEKAHILPAITAVEPQLAATFEKEDEANGVLAKRLQQLLNIFRATTLAEEKLVAGSAVVKAFHDFMLFHLEHMAKEEIELSPVLRTHYTDEQLLEMNQHMVDSISQEEKAISARWMMRGINKMEAISWLKVLKQQVPEPVFLSVYALARTELPMHLRIEVQESVMEHHPIY